jgi:pimeloyl-ACP methyl ester carboxylesterase
MKIIDRGGGTPIVVIPGIQGRWEWMAPAVDALAEQCRVITFSLADEPLSGFAFDQHDAIGSYVDQVREALDRAGIDRAVIVGVSFSGLLATEFAARHPDRVLGLVLSSALPPGWSPDARARFYLRAPRLLSPVFWVTSPSRMFPEMAAALAFTSWPRFMFKLGLTSVQASLSPTRMARRVSWTTTFAFSDATSVQAPALVITGEDRLDRIVRPELTRQYLTHLPQAKHVTLAATGHIGLITKPREFAAIICRFASEAAAADDNRLSA